MTNYEIMLVVDGNMSEADANAVSADMQKLLKGVKNLKETKMGLKKMAYKIGKCSQAYYFVLNFACENATIIKEFNRLALIEKAILRHLIINLENNYGYRATQNAKKVAKAKEKAKIYEARQKKIDEMIAAKKAAMAAEAEAKAAEAKKEPQDE